MKSKYILKKLYLRYFPEELLVNKQGFSGFPNESSIYLGDTKDFKVFEYLNISKDILKNENIPRDLEWKLINIEYFLRQYLK